MNEKNKKISTKDSDLRKQTIKNIVFKVVHGLCYVCTALFVAVCIVACATANKTKKASAEAYNDEIVLVEDIHQRLLDSSESESESESVSYPIYDDENKTITFSAYQFNNYHWDNLSNVLSNYQEITLSNLSFTYDSDSYDYSDSDASSDGFRINFDNSVYTISLSYFSYDNKFSYVDGGYDIEEPFEYDIVFILDNDTYSNVKIGVQSDIEDNNQPINVGIFEGLTASIVAFVNTLGVGITNIFSIFWANGSLTAFGWLTIIVVAVSLTYFVFRLIIGLIRLRG